MQIIPWVCAVFGLFVVFVEIFYLILSGSFAGTWVLLILGLCQFFQGFYLIALHRAWTVQDETKAPP